MNEAELCGRVIRVSFAKQQKLKEGSNKPIWMDENYYKNRVNLDLENNSQKNTEQKILS